MSVSIQKGNSKLGHVLNISLPPGKTCSSLPCFTEGCYARKFYDLRANVRQCWDGNYEAWVADPSQYFADIATRIKKDKPKLFRFHCGGDIPSSGYLRRMCELADLFNRVKFLAFTKRYEWVYAMRNHTPKNLRFVLSMWPGVEVEQAIIDHFPCTWMRDPKNPDPRIPRTALNCPGGCDSCGLCWHMEAGQSVVFDRH